MKRGNINLSSVLCGLMLLGLTSAQSAVAQDTELPPRIEAGDYALNLCGEVALRAVLGIFKYGYGGLYLANCADYMNVTGDVPKQWSVLLTRDADGETLTRIAEEALSENFNEQQLAGLDEVFSCMTNAYEDTPDGGRIDVRYLPGTGLQLWRNGAMTAHCGGGAGAAEYFRIWFGDEPFNDSMKERILEQASEAAEASQGDSESG